MKRIFVVLIILAWAGIKAGAQDEKAVKYRGTVELGTGNAAAFDWYYFGALVSTTHGVEINNSLTISAGLGFGPAYVERKDHSTDGEFGPTLSFFGNVDYAFLKGATTRPFIALRGGYFGSVGTSGPSCSAGGGVRFKDRWNFAILYRLVFVNDGQDKGIVHFPSLNAAYRF